MNIWSGFLDYFFSLPDDWWGIAGRMVVLLLLVALATVLVTWVIYRILRRMIGEESWTEDDIYGLAKGSFSVCIILGTVFYIMYFEYRLDQRPVYYDTEPQDRSFGEYLKEQSRTIKKVYFDDTEDEQLPNDIVPDVPASSSSSKPRTASSSSGSGSYYGGSHRQTADYERGYEAGYEAGFEDDVYDGYDHSDEYDDGYSEGYYDGHYDGGSSGFWDD